MAFVPLTVLLLFVVIALGGPVQFANTVANWAADFAAYVMRVSKSF